MSFLKHSFCFSILLRKHPALVNNRNLLKQHFTFTSTNILNSKPEHLTDALNFLA